MLVFVRVALLQVLGGGHCPVYLNLKPTPGLNRMLGDVCLHRGDPWTISLNLHLKRFFRQPLHPDGTVPEKYFGFNTDFSRMSSEMFYCQFQLCCMVLPFQYFNIIGNLQLPEKFCFNFRFLILCSFILCN